MEADFSGWATKAGLKCSDGRTILPNAFQHQDKMQVPLVWSHKHSGPENVLGHVLLENRPDGVYAYGYFNDTKPGQNAKALVQHKDVNKLSIYANQLVEKASQVVHGMIREVSLVLAGANPGAVIDYVSVQHGDGSLMELEDEAIIHTGLEIEFGVNPGSSTDDSTSVAHGTQGMTAQEVYDGMSTVEKDLVHYMVAQALESAGVSSDSSSMPMTPPAQHSATGQNDETSTGGTAPGNEGGTDGGSGTTHNEGDLTHTEGSTVGHNVFEQQNGSDAQGEKHVLTHDAMKGIFTEAARLGSLKEAVQQYALAHGIENIDVLFPNAKNITGAPDFIKRRTEWVAGVLGGTSHTPFSRIKTLLADITMDEARAKGYIKGSMKKEEFFSVSKRTTGPTLVYKKQKLDRQDIIDITDFDVVTWIKGEMRLMLEEELARAVLIGDGRDVSDEDKIKDPVGAQDGTGIRSILNDHEMYVTTVNVNLTDASSSYTEAIDAIISSMQFYRGTGTPVLYTTLAHLTKMLLLRDTLGRRIYRNRDELASELGVSSIQTVEPMEGVSGLLGIIVNLNDYNIGADKGGEVSLFDAFDIDYNQYKYLIETYVSGALTKYKSALVIKTTASTDVLVDPVTAPTFVNSTGVVTIPTQTHVVYKNYDTGATLSAGAQTALAEGASLTVVATPASGYFFNNDNVWTFTRVG